MTTENQGAGEGQQQQQQQQGDGQQSRAAAVTDFSPFYGDLTDDDKTFLAGRKFDPAKTSGRDLLEVMRGQDKLIGKNNLETPDLSNDEALAKWPGWKALGVPDSADGYKLKEAKDYKLPDGMEWDAEGEKLLRGSLFKGRVPAKMAQSIADDFINGRIAQHSAMQQQMQQLQQQTETKLRADWGDNYDTEMKTAMSGAELLAKKAGVKLDGPAIADRFALLAGDEQALRMLHYLGKQNAEDTIDNGDPAKANSPAAAKAAIEQLKLDSDFNAAYGDADHPGHRAAVEKMSRLQQLAHPEPKK